MASAVGGIKRCPKCDQNLDVSCFGKDSKRPDGLKCWCKDCHNAASRAHGRAVGYVKSPAKLAWIADNNDKIRGYVRKWQALNPEKNKENCQRWLEANRGRANERARGYYEEDKETFLARAREWRADNQEWVKQYTQAYRADNPEIIRAGHRRRRALLKGAEGTHTAEDVARIAKMQNNKCAYCRIKITPESRHVDHIVSLSKGGSNFPSNLQLLCAPCNLRKNDKDPLEFSQLLGLLI